MELADLFDTVKSGVLKISFVNSAAEDIASGSAFVVGRFVVTNFHVFRGPPGATVLIRSVDSDAKDKWDGIRLDFGNFTKRLRTSSDEQNADFAVLEIPEVLPLVHHRLAYGETARIRVGSRVALLGYPFGRPYLAIHSGSISSIYEEGPVTVFQIDASVNHGNSGGPLIDLETGLVIGIVTRKATGLTKLFESLCASFDRNYQILSSVQGMMSFGGPMGSVSPIQGIAQAQLQMTQLAIEIERSANVGIGYAFAVDRIASDNIFQTSV